MATQLDYGWQHETVRRGACYRLIVRVENVGLAKVNHDNRPSNVADV